MKNPVIFLVDDEKVFLLSLKKQIVRLGYEVVTATSGQEALALLREQPADVVITDLVMPEMGGIELMQFAKELYPSLPFIVFTARGCVESAVNAIKLGALDYLEKPFTPEAFNVVLLRALEFGRLSGENKLLRGHFCELYSFQNIVTQSPAMRQVLELAAQMVESPTITISLTGESGVGKEVLARAIHYASDGLPGNFVAINCAAIPESLLESELFGHVRGAFTGADREREGKFSQAKGGTLLLDEIGDMPLALQAKLLRVLEERTYEKIGGSKPILIDCRVIVATHRNLAAMIQGGSFREDLFYRINVVPITIPPLRARKEDIPLLIKFFLERFCKQQGKAIQGVSRAALEMLSAYDWPGNVRELHNVMEYAAILVQDGLIRPEHLRIQPAQTVISANHDPRTIDFRITLPVEKVSLEAITQKVLEIALKQCHGNKSKAADLLKVSRKIFYR